MDLNWCSYYMKMCSYKNNIHFCITSSDPVVLDFITGLLEYIHLFKVSVNRKPKCSNHK